MLGWERSWRRTLPLAFSVIVIAAHAGPAIAQGKRTEQDARQEFDKGVRAAEAGNYEEALEHYKRSYKKLPHPRTQFNLATIADHLGRTREAFDAYRNFISTATPRDRELVSEAERRVEVLARRLRARVTINSTPPGATVYVDGNSTEAGKTPLELELTPGGHVFRLVAPGRQTTQVTSEIQPLIEQPLASVLLPPAPASLHIRSEPRGALIAVDDVPVGTTPLLGGDPFVHDVVPGTYRVKVSKPGYLHVEKTISLDGPQSLGVEVLLRPPRSRTNKVVLGTVLAVGLAAVATGAVIGYKAYPHDESLDHISDLVLFPGLAVCAGSVVGWFVTRPEPSEIRVEPVAR